MKKGIELFLAGIVGSVIGMAMVFKIKQKEKEKWKIMSDKHLTLMLLLNQWMRTKQEGKSIVEYFHKNEITNIAIYGMSYIGERLYDELDITDIKVKYAIDQNADNIYSDINVLLPDEDLPQVDAIVVTPVYHFYEIKEMLSGKMDCKIVSLEDVLCEL